MHKFYIDVPYGYTYEYENGEQSGPEVLTRDFGVKFTFICNAASGFLNHDRIGLVGNKGDAHMVEVETEADELVILLKTGWVKLNNDVVENYIKQHRKEMVV